MTAMTVTSLSPRVPNPSALAVGIGTLKMLAVDGDFDGAALWLAQMREGADSPGLDALRRAMDRLLGVLGPPGANPSPTSGVH
jgi:hypothetical protein